MKGKGVEERQRTKRKCCVRVEDGRRKEMSSEKLLVRVSNHTRTSAVAKAEVHFLHVVDVNNNKSRARIPRGSTQFSHGVAQLYNKAEVLERGSLKDGASPMLRIGVTK
jgi:hypothetical protein